MATLLGVFGDLAAPAKARTAQRAGLTLPPGIAAGIVATADLPDLITHWQRLEQAALEANPFASSDFLIAAIRHFPAAAAPRLLAIWTKDSHGAERDLIGLFPLGTASGGALRAWSHPFAPCGIPLIHRDFSREALTAALAFAAGADGSPAALQFRDLTTDGPFGRLLREVTTSLGLPLDLIDPHQRAALGAEPAAEDKRRTKERRRLHRRLAERGNLAFEVVEDYNDFRPALEEFLTLEASGWKGRNRTALIQNPTQANFTRAMLWAAARAGKARIVRLAFDGRSIASGILLGADGHGAFWKIAYCESHAAFSPGALLAMELATWMRSAGTLKTLDSCAIPGHKMIESVWSGRIAIADAMIGLTPGRSPSYTAAFARERLRRSLRARLKTVYKRLFGRG